MTLRLAVTGLLLLAGTGGALDLEVEPAFPVRGAEARITVAHEGSPVPGAEVRALYRPNSEVSADQEIGRTDASGAVAWVPDDAGIVEIHVESDAGAAFRPVSVRFSGPPVPGLLVLILAGVILFGGNLFFVVYGVLRARD